MRPRSLLVLAFLVLALAAFLWFVERDLPGTAEREERARRLLPDLERAVVIAMAVETEEGPLRLERVAGPGEGTGAAGTERAAAATGGEGAAGAPAAWRIAAPPGLAGARADGDRVEALLGALAALGHEGRLEDVEPEAVGLADPRARVVLETGQGNEGSGGGGGGLELRIGGEVPASRNVVVEVRGGGREGVYVVDRAFLADLQGPAGDWRSRDLFPATRAQVTRVTLLPPEGVPAPAAPASAATGDAGAANRPAGAVVLEPAPDGGFRVVAPFREAADPPAVDELLAALTGLRAEAFVDDAGTPGGPSLAELGLAPPRGAVVVETGAGDPLRIDVGAATGGVDAAPGAAGGLYLGVDGRVVVAEAPLPAAVQRPAGDWASRQLTRRRVYEVERLAVEGRGGAEVFRLERRGVDWRRESGGRVETIPYTAVTDLLYALTETRADRTFPGAAVRLPAPEWTFRLGGGTTPEEPEEESVPPEGEDAAAPWEETLALHPRDREGFVPVTVAGRDRVLVLPPRAAGELRAAVEAVRDAEPLPPAEPPDAEPAAAEPADGR